MTTTRLPAHDAAVLVAVGTATPGPAASRPLLTRPTTATLSDPRDPLGGRGRDRVATTLATGAPAA